MAKVAAARVKVAHWAADITTVAPPHGTCSGDAARVLATVLHKKVQGWAKEIRSLALCKRRLPQKLLESLTEFFILRMLLEMAAHPGKELGVIGRVGDLEWHFGGHTRSGCMVPYFEGDTRFVTAEVS